MMLALSKLTLLQALLFTYLAAVHGDKFKKIVHMYSGVEDVKKNHCLQADRHTHMKWTTPAESPADLVAAENYARGADGAVCDFQLKEGTPPTLMITSNPLTLKWLIETQFKDETTEFELWWGPSTKFAKNEKDKLTCTKANLVRIVYGVQCGAELITSCDTEPDFSKKPACATNWEIHRYSRTDIDSALVLLFKTMTTEAGIKVGGFFADKVPFTTDENLLVDNKAKFKDKYKAQVEQLREIAIFDWSKERDFVKSATITVKRRCHNEDCTNCNDDSCVSDAIGAIVKLKGAVKKVVKMQKVVKAFKDGQKVPDQ